MEGRAGAGRRERRVRLAEVLELLGDHLVGDREARAASPSKPSYFTLAISGRTSKRALYEKLVPAASFCGSMAGCDNGCTFFSESALGRVSSTSSLRDVERDAVAVEVRQDVTRRFSRAKAPYAGRLLERLVGLVDLGLHAIGGDLDLELDEHRRKLLHFNLHGRQNVHAQGDTSRTQAATSR